MTQFDQPYDPSYPPRHVSVYGAVEFPKNRVTNLYPNLNQNSNVSEMNEDFTVDDVS